MLAIERQRKILENARKAGAVKTQELAAILGVTEETVRRDLDALSRQGLLHRTHGGATEISMMFQEIPQIERAGRQQQEKTEIAKAAVKTICPGETLIVDASSTVIELVRILPGGMNLRVVTYALDVFEKLAGREDIETILLGGTYEQKGSRFRGLTTETALRTLRLDRFYFSGGGFDTNLGIGEPNPEEARFKAIVMAQATWRCALMDHTKLGRETDHYFVKPSEIDLLLTNASSGGFFGTRSHTGGALEIRDLRTSELE